MRITVLFDNLGPYHLARLTAAAERCELTAIELHAKSRDYLWRRDDSNTAFARRTVFGDSAGEADSRAPVAMLTEAIQKSAPQVMAIPGWSGWHAFAALDWCIANKVPAVVMSESTAHDEPRKPWKEWIKRKYVGLCSAALVGGTSHEQYLLQLGMRADKIFFGYDTVDNRHFGEKGAPIRAAESEWRQRLALPSRYFLASSRFIAKKNLATLLTSYAEYRAALAAESTAHRPWDLVLLGDGELRESLLALREQLGLAACVHFPGFQQYDVLPAYYSLASAFVHASMVEPWGLVVNEAMASGLPVLVSNRCGCAPSLVQDGENGHTFDPADTVAITNCLLEMTRLSSAARDTMGRRSREIVDEYAPESFAAGLHDAASVALASQAKDIRLVDKLVLHSLLRSSAAPRRRIA
ncbi:MAG TPA: glycosyltransferase [Lacipirellulaceae bacterium]|jgi:glycosyltransferase involved in cell wall biosynthesis|nr:glycosyltransferase [Lacipirellulaceae bacterium]